MNNEYTKETAYELQDYEIRNGGFKAVVEFVIKNIKRIKHFEIDGLKIQGTVTSNSRISTWHFKLNFDNDGFLTGEYSVISNNHESIIPSNVAKAIVEQIELRYPGYLSESNIKHSEYIRTLKIMEKKRIQEEQAEIRRLNKEKIEKRIKIFLKLIVITLFVLLMQYFIFVFKQLIPFRYSYESLIGLEYSKVVDKLEMVGFTNVNVIEIEDLTINDLDKENIVTEIKVEFLDTFTENTKYPSNFGIDVVYHTIELHYAPITSKDAKGENYADVVDMFKNKGFINVETNVEYDLITGFITKDGSVESITINDRDYYGFDKFRLDAKVVITYHTFKNNKPKK